MIISNIFSINHESDLGVMVVLDLVESTKREIHFASAIDHLAMIMAGRLLLIEETQPKL